MTLKLAASVMVAVALSLLNQGCVYVGPTTGTDHAHVEGGKATITISPTTTFSLPVHVAIGDKVAEAAANAAVGYLSGPVGPITSLLRSEAVQKGIAAGMAKAAETGQQVDRDELAHFVQKVVEKI